jgi:hypothetical protein
VNIKEIDPSPYNPPKRTEDVEDLKLSIGSNGQLEPIHVVRYPSGRFKTADGHRREHAVKELGLGTVRVIVHAPEGEANDELCDKLVAELFEELNGNKMTFKNGPMLQAYLRGGPAFNSQVRAAGNYLRLLFNDSIPTLILDNATPTLVSHTKKVVKYIKPGLGTDYKSVEFKAAARKTILWLIRNEMQQKTIAYMRLGYKNDGLERAIDQNKSELPHLDENKIEKAGVRLSK